MTQVDRKRKKDTKTLTTVTFLDYLNDDDVEVFQEKEICLTLEFSFFFHKCTISKKTEGPNINQKL